MKTKIFNILLFFFLCILFPFTTHGNTNTREYCEELLDSARKEFFARNYIKSTEILTIIQPIIKENKFVDLEMRSLNLIGVIHGDLLVHDKAMELFLEVYKLAIKSHDLQAETMVLNNMATLYEGNNEYDKALEYLKKAYDVSLKLGDSIKIGEIAVNIARLAIVLKDTALAEQYLNIAKNTQTKYKRLLDFIQIVTADLFFLKQEYTMAETIATGIIQEDMEQLLKNTLFFLLSKIYQRKGEMGKAIQYLQKILEERPTIKEKIKAYEELSELYQENNSFVLALLYKDSVLQAKDSLYRNNNTQYLEVSRIQMELLNSEKLLTEIKAKQKAERILFIVITLLIIILIWVSYLMILKNKQRRIIELEKEKNQKLILEQQLKEQETFALLEQQRLSGEIENKNKQLTARILFQTNRSNLIKELIAAFSDTPAQKDNPILGSIIQKLKLQLKDSADANNFFDQLEQINPSFFSLLNEKHPGLSIDDIQILSYTYLYNTKTKKIASLLDISVNTCQKRKERVAVKLGIKTDELHNYLHNLMSTAIFDKSGKM